MHMNASLPGTHWLTNLEFRKKFWLIMLIFTLPMLYSARFIYQSESEAIAKTESQLNAMTASRSLLEQHSQVIDKQLQATLSGSSVNWSAIVPNNSSQDTDQLQTIVSNQEPAARKFRQWMQQLESTLEVQALSSGLLLDQHQQTVLNAQLQAIDLPRFHSVLAALTDHAITMARAGQFTPDSYIGLSQLYSQAGLQRAALDNKMALLSDTELLQQWQRSQRIIGAYINRIKQEFIDSDSLQADARLLFEEGKQVSAQLHKFSSELHARFLHQNQQHKQTSSRQLWVAATVFVVMAALAIYLVMAVNLSLSHNIKRVAGMARDIEQGHLDGGYPASGQDELGQVVDSLANAIRQMRDTVCAISENTQSLSSTSTTLSHSAQQLSVLGTTQKQQVGHIAEAANSLQQSAEEVDQLCRSAEQESSNTQKTAQSSAQRSEQSAGVIRQLAETIRDAADRITALAAQTAEIAGVTDVIKTIAEQTNLLALNAAIEAARAGEQGRGFAVVADEVRTLATRTQESTEEIEATIGSLQQVAEQAVDAMNNACDQANQGEQESLATGEAMTTILNSMASINQVIQQLTSAGTQQSHIASDISQNIFTVDGSASELLQQSHEVAASAEAVSAQSMQLSQQSGRFRI